MEPTDRPPGAPVEPRQRWRIRYRRRSDAPALPQREQLAAWEAALAVSGLPLVGLDLPTPRARIAFAAPLGVGVAGEGELLELLLTERRTAADVRVRLAGSMPAGHELLDVHDVWLGEPPLPGRVVAADYRATLGGLAGEDAAGRLVGACRGFLEARTVPRTRDKGGRAVAYDLRPLIAGLEVIGIGPAGLLELGIRSRFDPDRGVGRPDEVVAALADLIGVPLEIRSLVRERIVLADDRD